MAEIADNKSRTLALKSSDGKEFSISETAAVLSVVLQNMVADGASEGQIHLRKVESGTLEKVIAYLNKHADGGVSGEEKKKFDEEFVAAEEMKVLFQLVTAANFLHIKDLMNIVCQEVAERMKNKSVKWVRKTFNVENDFSTEEEKEIMAEYAWAWQGVESDGADL